MRMIEDINQERLFIVQSEIEPGGSDVFGGIAAVSVEDAGQQPNSSMLRTPLTCGEHHDQRWQSDQRFLEMQEESNNILFR